MNIFVTGVALMWKRCFYLYSICTFNTFFLATNKYIFYIIFGHSANAKNCHTTSLYYTFSYKARCCWAVLLYKKVTQY